ncbi:MAG TPA: substrate-binding domain-containing protein [Candidatus Baltobacteraceae bacterium]|nr:substrate-binding domain-containing protein [Candidatus Baltobacteraceae bacterium]
MISCNKSMPLPKPKQDSKTKQSMRIQASRDALALGNGAPDLEKTIRRLASTRAWDVHKPLPTTREIGSRYAISNATVCRLLNRLYGEGVIWRQENGRYFLNESRQLFERRKPYACLLRKLQHWSRVYQGVMSGFSQTFGDDRAMMLFVHNQSLVRHADIAHPPVHAGVEAQRESLAEFFRDNSNGFRGILLDEVWLDDVLKEFPEQLANAVIVCRPTTLPNLSSVSVDFESGALLAVGHLYARGFDEIWLAIPFVESVSVELMMQAAIKSAARLGKPIKEKNICMVASPDDRERLLDRVRSSKVRAGIFCFEDNISLILRKIFAAADIDCPTRVGLLSAMGTDLVVDQRISSLKIDFERIGRAAGEILLGRKHDIVAIPPQLFSGTST